MASDTGTSAAAPDQDGALADVLVEVGAVLDDLGVPYVAAGSIVSNAWGRPSAIGDIDILLYPNDSERVLETFGDRGFDTDRDNPNWLFKATKKGVTVDLIFEMRGGVYLDEEMVERATIEDVQGTKLRLMPAEDFVVSQALATTQDTPVYWFNALAVLSKTELDWDYLVERAAWGPRRVLSFMIYAQSSDQPVPDSVITRLYDSAYET